ncbi:MAG: glycosyl hydrolase family 28-related protein [Oscillospiraceae bacterium]
MKKTRRVISLCVILCIIMSCFTFMVYASDDRAYLNIVDFGAMGDGITDDQGAFDKATEEAKKSGLPVYVPPGTYLHSGIIKLDGVVMFGEKYELSIIKATTYKNECIFLTGEKAGLYNIYIIGTGGARNAWETGSSVYMDGCNDFVVANCRTVGATSSSITNIRSTNAKILNNYVSYSAADGNMNWCNSKNMEIANNLIWNAGDDGIAFTSFTNNGSAYSDQTQGVKCYNNAVFCNGGARGITINGGHNMKIYDNYVEGGVSSICIGADQSWSSTQNKDIDVFGNTLKNCGSSAPNNGGAITIRNDKGFDGNTDSSRGINIYDNNIYNPKYAAMVTYADYPVYGRVERNKIYKESNIPLYKRNSESENTKFEFNENMTYNIQDYAGDKNMPQGPDYSLKWDIPETDSNIAKGQNINVEDGEGFKYFEMDFGKDIEFNSSVIYDKKRSVDSYKIQYNKDGEWVDCAEGNENVKVKKNYLKECITTDKIKVIMYGENIKVDDFGIYKTRTLIDKVGKDYDIKLKKSSVSLGDNLEISVVSNKENRQNNAEISAYLYRERDDNIAWTMPEKVILKPQDKEAFYHIKVPKDAIQNNYKLEVFIKEGDNLTAKEKIQFNVVKMLKTEIVSNLVSKDEDLWEVGAIVTNYSSEKIPKSKISVKDGGKILNTGETRSLSDIEPGKSAYFPFKIKEKTMQDLETVVFDVAINGKSFDVITKNISFSGIMKTNKAPIIDGNITDDEWSNSVKFTLDTLSQVKMIPSWGGKEDLSGIGYTLWDKENLYIAVAVTDNVHNQTKTGADVWGGDSIQLAFDSARYNAGIYKEPGSEGYTEIGVALSGKETTGAQYTKPDNSKDGAFFSGKQKVTRSGNNTFYEISMPWNELLPDGRIPKSGDVFGFSLLINESDGGPRVGWIEYYDGIGETKNPKLYGEVRLYGENTAVNETENGNIKGYLDGELLDFSENPMVIQEGILYLPLKRIAGVLGYNIESKQKEEIFIENEQNKIILNITKNTCKINDEDVSLTTSPKLIENEPYVALSSVREVFKKFVYWDAKKQVFYIN